MNSHVSSICVMEESEFACHLSLLSSVQLFLFLPILCYVTILLLLFIGEACSTHRRHEKCKKRMLLGKLEGTDDMGDLCIDR
jgi:hypothetical protein